MPITALYSQAVPVITDPIVPSNEVQTVISGGGRHAVRRLRNGNITVTTGRSCRGGSIVHTPDIYAGNRNLLNSIPGISPQLRMQPEVIRENRFNKKCGQS